MTAPDLTDLKEMLDAWALDTAAARLSKRANSTFEEIQSFHEAMLPRLRESIEFLNAFPVDGIPAEHRRLSYAVLAILEVDDAVNLWRRPNLKMASDIQTWYTKKSFYDQSS